MKILSRALVKIWGGDVLEITHAGWAAWDCPDTTRAAAELLAPYDDNPGQVDPVADAIQRLRDELQDLEVEVEEEQEFPDTPSDLVY